MLVFVLISCIIMGGFNSSEKIPRNIDYGRHPFSQKLQNILEAFTEKSSSILLQQTQIQFCYNSQKYLLECAQKISNIQKVNGAVQLYKINKDKKQLLFFGSMRNSLRRGYGREYYGGNMIYEGYFSNNRCEGWGFSLMYLGEFSLGYKNGWGVFNAFSEFGVKYVGTWKNDLPHGRGQLNVDEYQLENFLTCTQYDPGKWEKVAIKYAGQWYQGKIMGFGKMEKRNGQVYKGHFYDGNYHGEGLLWYDGKYFEGIFQSGKFKQWKSLKIN